MKTPAYESPETKEMRTEMKARIRECEHRGLSYDCIVERAEPYMLRGSMSHYKIDRSKGKVFVTRGK